MLLPGYCLSNAKCFYLQLQNTYPDTIYEGGELGFQGEALGKKEQKQMEQVCEGDIAYQFRTEEILPEVSMEEDVAVLGYGGRMQTFAGNSMVSGRFLNGREFAGDEKKCVVSDKLAVMADLQIRDRIRIHPIITKGGDVVNSIPDDVRIETYIRGATAEAIRYGCSVVDRCAEAAAKMMDTSAAVRTIPGYLPLRQDPIMTEEMAKTARNILPESAIGYGVDSVGSSDVGDLSCLMPVIQPTMGGFVGSLHSPGFLGGQLLSALTYSLLSDGGAKAKRIIKESKPLMTRQEYLRYLSGR